MSSSWWPEILPQPPNGPSDVVNPGTRPLPVEEVYNRYPEWEVMYRTYGDSGESRQFWWDPVYGYVWHEGPIVQVDIGYRKVKPY